ncbi:MAG: TPM domain-containing protein [Bacteroidota bacterium]
MRYGFFFTLVFVAAHLNAQSTVDSIPNQKLISGSYVSNPDRILSDATVANIDTLLRNLEKKTTVQVAVVAVSSIGERDIFEFAQELFTAWGIGSKGNDNGLLLLLVDDIHTIRFHTGYGVEGALPDATCKRIQRDYMVPEFKKGDYNAGMVAGLQEVEKILTDPAYAEELKKPDEEVSDWVAFVTLLIVFIAPVLLVVYLTKAVKGRFTDSKKPSATPYAEMRMKRWPWLLMFVGVPVMITTMFGLSGVENPVGMCFITLYLYFMATLFRRLWRMKKVINRFMAVQDYYEIVEFIRKQQWYWFFMAIFFPLPFAFYFFYHLARKRIYRNHPRKCKQCLGDMHKLNEKNEDEYLSQSMQMEEVLRSVDYDVWKCGACQSIEVWHYLNRLSKYEPCPKCKTIAYCFISSRTLVAATYSSSGTGEQVHGCKFCGHTKKSTYSIAQLTRSTSSGSSSIGGSSSSGGSWGGGRSGGGGASSSW